ncbi:hypothetical protein HYH02_005285 [Chlamydomonas schloesseri]|uniref:Seipin n=1 Tax=Chlamydomonas schloesseri TaxID=2026947 RepID=A0A835WN80_9CHLO|nr:hypothetical protein HYH02_005285 [Chlamydomonas schloesseri]|eukprot:KAG2449760.1 hypothetical protein HYH02_005285 [Chlamydomonas schloesseri]
MEIVRRATGLAPAVVTCGAALSACCAVVGYSLLSFLFLTRYYAPATHHFVRPLHFDYTGFVAVAVAPLSPNLHEKLGPPGGGRSVPGAAAAAVLPKSRFLPLGTQVAVHVKLVIPWDHTDLFQVTGELMTNATHVAARSTRTYINTPPPYLYRLAKNMVLLPLHVLGWGTGEWVHVDLPLFDAYEDREEAPVAVFRARLASRNTSKGGLPPPPVHKAELHVRLKLGPLQTALFWLRPGLALSVVLLVVGLTTALGGTAFAVGLAVLACLLSRWVAASNAEAAKSDKGGGGGRRGRGRLLPIAPPAAAAQRKDFGYGTAPYGNVEDAMSYSLAHAQYFRGGGGNGGGAYDGHEEEHEQAGSPGEESWPAAGEAPAGKGDGRGGGGCRVQEQPSEATSTWTGTGSSAVGGHTPTAPSSTAMPASSSVAGHHHHHEGARGGSPQPAGRPTPTRLQPETEVVSATPVSGKLSSSTCRGGASTGQGSEDLSEDAELVGEGDEAGEDVLVVQPAARASRRPGEEVNAAVPPVIEEGEEVDEDVEEQGPAGDERHEEGRVAGGKAGAGTATRAGSGGSDLAPQADNVADSGAGAAAVRRRAGFAWKA